MSGFRQLLHPLSRIGETSTSRLGYNRSRQLHSLRSSFLARGFSSGKNSKSDNKYHDDPFGVDFEDGTDHGKLGPSMPPKYKRDSMTGKFTGETETELSERER